MMLHVYKLGCLIVHVDIKLTTLGLTQLSCTCDFYYDMSYFGLVSGPAYAQTFEHLYIVLCRGQRVFLNSHPFITVSAM